MSRRKPGGGPPAGDRLHSLRHRLGRFGERTARGELERRGYCILAANYRGEGGEADLVAEHEGDLVFVEVKTRSGLRHGLPAEAVSWTKQQRLGRAAMSWCGEHGGEERPIRYDIVEVIVLNGRLAGVEVHRAAFVPEE